MSLVHQTKSEFIRQTLEKHGFRKGNLVAKPIVRKNQYDKPLIPIHESTHDRFADQGRKNVVALIQQQGGV